MSLLEFYINVVSNNSCFVVVGIVLLILWFMDNLWFDDLRAVLIGDCFNIVFSRDIIICG